VGVGKNFSLLDKFFFKLSFRYIDDIYVRDQQSALNLEANFSRKAKIIPDIAYFLPKVLPEVYKEQSAYLISPVEYSVFKRYYQEVGGVFLNEDEYIHNWIEAINDSMDKEKISKIYLAATTINDLNFTKVLFDRLKSYPNSQKNIQLIKNVDLDEYISLLHKCQSVLSGRMHALILGHSIGLKVLPYKISQKIESYQKEYLQYDADYFREKLIELRAEIL
ncbi:MAG: polysaccharide pyruvyl transferase family protein, partial [Campylobacterales bacterium]|nr:polysaccharide pyruvyl transferase family protein [Campylobacterales bacterium]